MRKYPLPDDRADAVQADALQVEKTKLLYAGLPNALIINALLALILAGVQSAVIPLDKIFAWLAIFGSVLLARMVLATAWRRQGVDVAAHSPYWMSRFRISVIATGMAWGTGAVLLFPDGNVTHQVSLSFVLAGMSAGAITLLAVDRVSMLGFLVPTLLPLIACFGLEDSTVSLAMGAMVTLFLFFIASNAAHVGRSLHENFMLRIRAEEQKQVLRRSETRLNQAQRSAHIGNWELDLVGDTLYWSAEIYRIFEIDPTKFGASYEAFLNAIHPDDRDRVNQAYTDSLISREPYDIVHRLRFADGRIKFVHERCMTEFDAEGKALRSLGTIQDITERKKDEIALQESEARFRFMLENSPIAARITNTATGQVVFANQRYAALMESEPSNVLGINPDQYYANPQDYAEVLEQLGRGEQVTNRLVEMLIPNEHERTKWVLASYLQLEYQNEPALLGWFYEITDRKEMEEKIQHLAYHDPLTDLPNRMLFTDRLQQALSSAKRDKGKLALMFIDLDKFKPVNDMLGHNVGDLLLKEVAQRILCCLRESDTVGRIGGDEFVVLLPSIKAEQDALEVAEKIRYSLDQPFELAGCSLNISSSTGIAIYPEHGNDEKLLLKNADDAMYYAKSVGRDNVQIYRADMQDTNA